MANIAIETAAGTWSVAVSHQGDIQQFTFEHPRQQTQSILPAINDLLTTMGVKLSQVELVTVSIGPGSFTGLRVGVSVAQALAWANDIPVLPVSTLRVLAQSAYSDYGYKHVIVGLNAYMNELYWGEYAVSSSNLVQALERDCLLKPAMLPQLTHKSEAVQLIGDAWQVYKSQYSSEWAALTDEAINITPQARDLLYIAQHEDCFGLSVSAASLTPVYLRDSSAWQTSLR